MMKLLQDFNARYPIFLAPMAGGPGTPELAAAVSRKGGVASLGAAYLSPEQMETAVKKLRGLSDKPFILNLFIPGAPVRLAESQKSSAIQATYKFREKLALPAPSWEGPFEEDFEKQFAAVLKLRPAALSFVFGQLKPAKMEACRQKNILLIGTATTAEEASLLAHDEVDAIILQGFEAGGHRGIFDAGASDPMVSTENLVKEFRPHCKLPLIAAGGIHGGEALKKALMAGANGGQIGTAFLLCPEAGTNAPYRKALREKRATKLTRAFSGRLARGLENEFMRALDAVPEAILPFPAQNKFTRDIRMAGSKAAWPEVLSLWAGTAYSRAEALGAEEIMDNFILGL